MAALYTQDLFNAATYEGVAETAIGMDYHLEHCQRQGFGHRHQLLAGGFGLSIGALDLALGFAPLDVSHSAEIRVASILTDLGFTQIRPRNGGDRRRRYSRE